MGYASKIVLALPINDPSKLAAFVEDCLRDQVVLIAVAGHGSDDVEESIDWLIIGDGSDESRFIVTSSHGDEPLSEVMDFAELWSCEDGRSGVDVVRL